MKLSEKDIFDLNLAAIKKIPVDVNMHGRPSEMIAQVCTLNTITLMQEHAIAFTTWMKNNSFEFNSKHEKYFHKDFPNFISEHHNMWYTVEDIYKLFIKYNNEKI